MFWGHQIKWIEKNKYEFFFIILINKWHFFVFPGIPSCIEEDQQFAKDQDLQFRDVYQNDDSGITLKNSDQVDFI